MLFRSVAHLPMSTAAQKIRDLGLEDTLVTLLASGMTIPKIVKVLNDELEGAYNYGITHGQRPKRYRIYRNNVDTWLNEMSEETSKLVLESRDNVLRAQMQDFINQSFRIREEVIQQLTDLTEEELKSGTKTVLIRNNKGDVLGTEEVKFTPNDRKALSNILLDKIKVQESAEKLMGIDSGKGANPTKKEDANDNVLDRMKDKIRQRKKAKKEETIIEANYEDVDNDEVTQ